MEFTIKTVYHIRGKKPRIVRSKNANRAVMQCVGHMQINHYGSHLAEVYDEDTGERHCCVKRSIPGELNIEFDRDPAKFETKYAASYILGF